MKTSGALAMGLLLSVALIATAYAEPVAAKGTGKAQQAEKAGKSVHEQYKKRVEVKKRAAEKRKAVIMQQQGGGK